MPRKVKDKWIGARVDEDMENRVEKYIDSSDSLNLGELVRNAVEEYMVNHPITVKE